MENLFRHRWVRALTAWVVLSPLTAFGAADEMKAVAELEAEVNKGGNETRSVGPVPIRVQKVATADIQPLVKGEYGRTQQDLQWELTKLKQRQVELETQRDKARDAATAEAETNRNGIKVFKEYDRLLSVRYSSKTGDFEPGVEISSKEVENINQLFQSHLRTVALSGGRISAGNARRSLEWGIERLGKYEDWNTSPNEQNNSDFEIIAKQLHDVDSDVERVMDLADKIDVKLNPDAALASVTPPEKVEKAASPKATRAPAAQAETKPKQTGKKKRK